MAGFSDLSNELVLEILRQVPPSDLVSACTLTKSISLLAAPILEEHRRLKHQYSIISNANGLTHPLAKLLINILAEPRIAHYVRSLTWEWDLLDDIGSPTSVQSQNIQYESKDLLLLRTAVETAEVIGADEVDEWLQAIQDGTDDPGLALLLLYLPKLESLEINSTGIPITYLFRTTQRIKNAPAGTYLSHLKHLSITLDEDWPKRDMMGFLMSLMSLPSLNSCHIQDLAIRDDERKIESTLCPQRFNITDLTFTGCEIGNKTLFELLKKTENLESFCCIFPPRGFQDVEPWQDWYWLGIGLLHHAKQTLKEVTLLTWGQHGGEESEVCSFRDFEALREIDTELSVFLNRENSDMGNFPEMLPASIQKLHLRAPTGPFPLHSEALEKLENIREAVLSILEVKNVLLPQLTEIHVHKLQYREESCVFADIPKACDAQGVFFTLV